MIADIVVLIIKLFIVFFLCLLQFVYAYISVAFSPRANHTDRAAAAGRRS